MVADRNYSKQFQRYAQVNEHQILSLFSFFFFIQMGNNLNSYYSNSYY